MAELNELMERAKHGDADAEAEIARQYAMKGDWNSCIEWNRRAIEHGSIGAMVALSSIYRKGNGIPADEEEANRWLIKAADADNGVACFSVAGDYETGREGFEKNPEKAFYYTKKMANINGWDSQGRFQLAQYYAIGFGTAPNIEKAFSLWNELSDEGYADASYKVACMYAVGKGREKDMDTALQYANKALNQTDTTLLYKIETIHQMAGKMVEDFSEEETSSGGCYIATAVYGSYDCPQVWVLRRFRDYRLANSWYGRTFIKVYYAISPTLVKWFGSSKWFVDFWKSRLDKMVSHLKETGLKDTPYQD